MKTFKEFSNNSVYMLKDAMIKNKVEIIAASEKKSYDIIDKIMKGIAKTHNISGQKLHDDWVKKYNITPDKWIKKQ